MQLSSVVQTGVKSFGCEDGAAQELAIHSWKRMRPSAVGKYPNCENPSQAKSRVPAPPGGGDPLRVGLEGLNAGCAQPPGLRDPHECLYGGTYSLRP